MKDGDEAYPLGEATCVQETALAILVVLRDMDNARRWIPKSVLHDESEVRHRDDDGALAVKQWWADTLAVKRRWADRQEWT